MSDVRTPRVHYPPCAKCGIPSLGAVMLEMEPVSPSGQPIMTVEFYCADHRPPELGFVVMADRLYPAYRILYMADKSRVKLMRLDREAQEKRLRE